MLFNTISVHNLTNELCRIYMPIVIFLRCNDGNTNINGWTLMFPLGSALQTVKIQTDQSKQNSALRAQLLVRAITLYFFIYGTMIASVCTGICPSRAHKEVLKQMCLRAVLQNPKFILLNTTAMLSTIKSFMNREGCDSGVD